MQHKLKRQRFQAALIVLSLFAPLAVFTFAGEAVPVIPGVEKDEKPKEKPFKYSAWCAFRDLSSLRIAPPKENLETEHTRPGSTQWEGFGRRGHWSSLVVELRNTTEKSDYRGTATIVLNPLKANERFVTPYITTYRQDFEIGPQTTKLLKFSVLCPEDGWTDQVQINITANGRAFDTRMVMLKDLDTRKEELVVVVSESSGSFRFLQSSKKEVDDPRLADRTVAFVEPQDMPSRWHDLMMANLIIIDGPPREKLSDEQWAALRSYVQAGGHILITAGKDPSRLRGPVEELAGITVREMTEVAGLDGGASSDVNFTSPKPEFRLPLVDVTVNPKGSVEARYSKAKIVEMCTRYYGPGSVTFLPFSLSDRLLENWEGRSIIPIEIIRRGRDRGLFSNRAGYDEDLSPVPSGRFGGYNVIQDSPLSRTDSIVNLRHNLDEKFSNDTPVQMQAPSTVMSFLLFYLLCAVPINYFIFGWFRRREVAWLAVPIWAGSFSLLAYVVGYMGQTGQMTVNEVSVIEAGSGQDTGMARTFLGLYAPKRDDYRIEFPPVTMRERSFLLQAAPGHLLNVSQTEARNIENPELYLVDGDQGLSIERLRVQQRSTRRLEIVHRSQLGDGLDIKIKRRNSSSLDIEIQNNTGFALHLPTLIDEGRELTLGGDGNMLKPGEVQNLFDVTPVKIANNSGSFFSKQVFFKSARGEHARSRARVLNEYVQKQMEKYSRSERAVFCAWIDNERGALPLTVAPSGGASETPKIEGLTLLIVPVRVKEELSAVDLPDRVKIRFTQDYTPANGQIKWQDVVGSTAVQMKRDTSLPHQTPPAAVSYLSIELPKKYRELRNRDYQLKLWLTLDATSMQPVPTRGQKAPPQKPSLDGELDIRFSKMNDNGRLEWAELESPPVLGLKLDNTVTVGPIILPMNNYKAITNDTIQLRVMFIPNQALANIIASYNMTLINMECKMGRPNSNE